VEFRGSSSEGLGSHESKSCSDTDGYCTPARSIVLQHDSWQIVIIHDLSAECSAPKAGVAGSNPAGGTASSQVKGGF
jgi:hypothetical protein